MVFHLLVRAEVIPFEELKSFLNRTGEINHYDGNSWYLNLVGLELNRDINQSKSIEVFTRLSELTMLDILDLILMTPNRFTEFFYPPHKIEGLVLYESPQKISYRLPGDKNSKYFSGTRGSTRKICPLCLQQNHAFLLPWSVKFITTCPYHKIKLIDICPKCHKQLLVKNFKCASCGTSIELFNPLETLDNYGNLLSVLTWNSIGCNPFSGKLPMIPPSHPINTISPNCLINLLWELLHCMNFLYPEAKKVTAIGNSSIERIHDLLLKAIKLFINWPNNWVEFCREIGQRERENNSLRNNRHIFPHNLHKNLSGKDFEWLIEPLTILQISPEFNERKYWKAFFNQHKAMIDRNELIVKKICKNVDCDIKDIKVIYDYFDFSLADSLEKASNNFQVNFTNEVISKFVAEILPDVLISKQEKIQKNIYRDSKNTGNNFNRVQDFISRNLIAIEQEDEQINDFVTFKTACSRLQAKGVTFLQFYLLILFSVLPVFKIKLKNQPDALVIPNEDFFLLLESTNNHQVSKKYSKAEVEKVLNCSSRILQRLAEYHQLEPIDSSLEVQEWQYRKNKVDKFQWKNISPTNINNILDFKESSESLISHSEAINILQVPRFMFKRLCREGIIRFVFVFEKTRKTLFRRSEIIALRNSYYYDFEVAKLLNIHRVTLAIWKRKNHLLPVYDNLQKYSMYLKTEVDKLIGTKLGCRYFYNHVNIRPNFKNVFYEIKNKLLKYQLLLHPLNNDQMICIENVFNLKNPNNKPATKVSDKAVINSILHAIKNNIALRYCPSGFTCHKRLRKWDELGIVDDLIDELIKIFSVDEMEK